MRIEYNRRQTNPVRVGNLTIGGSAPIVVQSMANVNTNDIEGGIEQAARIIDAGGKMVRFTTQGTREAEALGRIRSGLHARGYEAPLVADVHFRKEVAFVAAEHADKVRINPGNFYDSVIKRGQSFSQEEFEADLKGLREEFGRFVDLCKKKGVAIRIGVNHGSLSGRIMDRYGDTPLGMVSGCMEYLEVCAEKGFDNVVISIKSSNTKVMAETVILLSKTMEERGMHYPLHLGVTEAGDGEDGRLKSAVGIGALLSLGLGDTIRVSLTEAPEAEIPVAGLLVRLTEELARNPVVEISNEVPTLQVFRSKTGEHPRVTEVIADYDEAFLSVSECERPDVLFGPKGAMAEEDIEVLTDEEILSGHRFTTGKRRVIEITCPNVPLVLRAMDELIEPGYIIRMKADYTPEEMPTRLGFMLGAKLLFGSPLGGLWLRSGSVTPQELARLSYGLLQASRLRFTKTEYIACPSCGRTLFDLSTTLQRVREATKHLRGLKIGVMGCVVNGPGEMADADYGYVGSGVGLVDLYKGKEKVERAIPARDAVSHLIDLIKTNGDWQEP